MSGYSRYSRLKKFHPLQHVTFFKNNGHIAGKIDIAFPLVSVSTGTPSTHNAHFVFGADFRVYSRGFFSFFKNIILTYFSKRI